MTQPDAIGYTVAEMEAAYRNMMDLRRRQKEVQSKLSLLL
jgi:hypothetical protein